jgi:hypothetical protein
MSATDWYLLGCASGAGITLAVCAFGAMAVWPDLKLMRTRGRG